MYPNNELWHKVFQVKVENNTTQTDCKNCKRLKTKLKKLERANRILLPQAGERYFEQRLGYNEDKGLYHLPDLKGCLTWPPRLDQTPPITPESVLYQPPQNMTQNEPMPPENEEQQLQDVNDMPINLSVKIEPEPHYMTTEVPVYPNDSPIMNPPLWCSPLHLTTETPFSVTTDLPQQNMVMKFESPFDGLKWESPNLSPWDPDLELSSLSPPFNLDPPVEIIDSVQSKTVDATTQTPGVCYCRFHFYET